MSKLIKMYKTKSTISNPSDTTSSKLCQPIEVNLSRNPDVA